MSARAPALVLAFLLAASGPPPAAADGFAAPSSLGEIVRDVVRARFVQATSYIVSPRSPLRAALVSACAGGAHVALLVSPSALVRSQNAELVGYLRGRGFAGPGSGGRCAVAYSRDQLHLKSVYVADLPGNPQGRVLYLSDENFSTGYYVRDDKASDGQLVAAAFSGRPGSDGIAFSTLKGPSLELEARAIDAVAAADGGVAMETESFGPNNPASDALVRQAGAGVRVRLIVASAEYDGRGRGAQIERDFVSSLPPSVEVRVSRATDKLVAGIEGTYWIGSTNATAGYSDTQADWGMAGRQGAIARMALGVFVRNWAAARPVR